jgi:hypothetical protein
LRSDDPPCRGERLRWVGPDNDPQQFIAVCACRPFKALLLALEIALFERWDDSFEMTRPAPTK